MPDAKNGSPMKALRTPLLLLLLPAVLAAVLAARAPAPRPPQSGVDAFLDKIDAKVAGFQEPRNWRGTVVSTITKMNRHWEAESVIVVTKAAVVADGRRTDEIKSALETSGGVTKDITKEYIEEDRKAHERYRRQRPPDAKPRDPNAPPRRRGLGASIEEYTPFSKARRPLFSFRLDESATLDGRPAVALDIEAKVKGEKNWEGRIYFDPATFDPLLLEAKPSENPRFVQLLEARIGLQVVSGRTLMLKATRIRVNAGFLFFKRVRQVAEDVYSDVELLDGRP
jgi:hypothetical protein